MRNHRQGPAHDPDDVLGQLAKDEEEDERQLRATAAAARLSVEQMRRALVAIDENIASVRAMRVAWRAKIRASATTTSRKASA